MGNDKSADDDQPSVSWLVQFRQMWRELPVRHKFHGFCVLLAGVVLLTTLIRENPLGIAIAGTVFALLLAPVIVESFLTISDRKLPPLSAKDREELRTLCQKLQELEQNTSLVLKLDGPRRLFREFPRLFPYAGDDAGGVVSRFASIEETQALKLLLQMHDIIRHVAS